jgi:hypothetical protein
MAKRLRFQSSAGHGTPPCAQPLTPLSRTTIAVFTSLVYFIHFRQPSPSARNRTHSDNIPATVGLLFRNPNTALTDSAGSVAAQTDPSLARAEPPFARTIHTLPLIFFRPSPPTLPFGPCRCCDRMSITRAYDCIRIHRMLKTQGKTSARAGRNCLQKCAKESEDVSLSFCGPQPS